MRGYWKEARVRIRWWLIGLLPLSGWAAPDLLEAYLKSPSLHKSAPPQVATTPKRQAQIAKLQVRSTPPGLEWLKLPDAKRIHPLDRFLLDADATRQRLEDEINHYVRELLPENGSVQLAPGSNQMQVNVVFRY